VDLGPLFDVLLSRVPAPTYEPDHGLQALVTNLDASPYVGRLALCRVMQGNIRAGQTVAWCRQDGSIEFAKVAELYVTEGLQRTPAENAGPGEIIAVAGFSDITIGETLADSKTDQRFVKNRHRKGGQSQRRFERIREKQIDELFGKACETAHEKLTPYEAEIQHVFLGGDRHTLQAFRKACGYFERFDARLSPRMLHVPGDPRRSSLEAMPREVWSSDLYTIASATEHADTRDS
jgi:hypothetical protein